MAHDERCVCWVDVERGDDDPVALFAKLRSILAPVVEIPEPSPVLTSSSNPYVEAVRSAFSVGATLQPFVLVLDDAHRLRSPVAGWIIEELVERLPPASTVVLVGRGHHDHAWVGRARLVPGVVDVTVDDLGFDASETHRFLVSRGVDPSVPGLARPIELLSGWPAGLQLAATSIRRGTEPPSVADQDELVDYLRNEWIHSLEPDALTFLREVACLERFTATACDEVLGRTGSAELLRCVHRDDLVVFRLDERAEWHRLHPLLARWLSADLRSVDPIRWTEVHREASKYWESRGDVDRAVDHATAAGDVERMEELLIVHGSDYLTRGLEASVEKWFDALPPERIRASPVLCGLRCVLALHQGDEVRAMQWKRLLTDAVDRGGGPTPGDPTSWWPTVVSGTIDERPAREFLAPVARARTQMTGGPWSAFACWTHGSLSFVVGAVDDAEQALAVGAFEAELTRNPLVQAHCLATSAVIHDSRGDTARALEKSRRATELLHSCGGDLVPAAAVGLATATLVSALDGGRDEAGRQLAIARAALTKFPSIAPWFNIIARIPLVRTALLLEDRDLGRALLHEIAHHARFEQAHPGGALAYVAELRQRVDVMHHPSSGVSALTDAELRVLEWMPTNLSLADIATRLFVSRNTVKSHAASIYRKLGADNRTQAVELAVAAGAIAAR